MLFVRRSISLAFVVSLVACGSSPPKKDEKPSVPYKVEDPAATAEAVDALQKGDFGGANSLAAKVLTRQDNNAQAAVVRAISGYQIAMRNLMVEARSVIDGAEESNRFDHARMRRVFEDTDKALAAASADLALAESDPNFSLELCLACWRYDWNMNGRVDSRDELLLQVEYDETGNRLPDEDPRRKPTIRFDAGDLHWGQAMLSFQRAALQLILAYEWTALDQLLASGPWALMSKPLVIKLRDKDRVATARNLIIKGLDHSDRSRAAYLAETDDDREWLPNPKQKNFPLPLPVDDALYETWAGVIGDVRGIVSGDTGISVAEVVALSGERLPSLPTGYVDIGAMLAKPKDISIDFAAVNAAGGGSTNPNVDAVLKELLGNYYVAKKKPTPLVRRIHRMATEISKGEDRVERKLRYLFWIN